MKPSQLDCGPYRHKVEYTSMKDDEGGEFSPGKILLNSGLGKMSQQVILMHEWLHALFDQIDLDLTPLDHMAKSFGIVNFDEENLEETIVRRIAPVLLDSLRRNKEALDWMLDSA